MRKGVNITILQRPITVSFTCSHCNEEIDIDYDELERAYNKSY